MLLNRRRGTVIMVLAVPLLTAIGAGMAWPLLLLPQVALLIHGIACWIERRIGSLSAIGFLLAIVLVLGYALGTAAWALSFFFLFAPLALERLVPWRTQAFWPSVLRLSCLLFSCSLAVLFFLWRWLGESPLITAVQGFESWLDASAQKTSILLLAYQAGYAHTTQPIPFAIEYAGKVILTPLAQQELFRSLIGTLDTLLRSGVPTQLVTGSMLGGLLGTALPRWAAARDMNDTTTPPAPPLYTWRAPNVLLMPALLLLLTLFVLGSMGAGAGALGMVLVFEALRFTMSIQGAAVADDLLRKRGMRRGARGSLVIAGYVLLNAALAIVGLMDALLNFRRIQPPGGRLLPPWASKDDEEDES